MLALADGFRELVEECLHAGGICVGEDQRESVVGAGLDRGIDVGGYVALVAQARWALATLPPDVTDASLLSDARFVLEIQAQPLIFVRTLNYF